MSLSLDYNTELYNRSLLAKQMSAKVNKYVTPEYCYSPRMDIRNRTVQCRFRAEIDICIQYFAIHFICISMLDHGDPLGRPNNLMLYLTYFVGCEVVFVEFEAGRKRNIGPMFHLALSDIKFLPIGILYSQAKNNAVMHYISHYSTFYMEMTQ